MSAEEHDREAAFHEARAAEHDAEAEQIEQADPGQDTRCFDTPLENVTYSGGEPYSILRPCWTAVTNPAADERTEAARHRGVAAKHRSAADRLRDAERDHCAGLGEMEIGQSPFAHRRDILSVEPVRSRGVLTGVTIVFRRVPGLSAKWMQRALHCHSARAAVLGFPQDFMTYSPMALPDVSVYVTETEDTVTVRLYSPRDEMAAAALGRAQDLIASPE